MKSKNNKKIIVRYPPSPTGNMTIGNARTILFNYLFAKQNSGEAILRFEDTDKERSKKEFEENILDTLSWLSLDFDGEPTRQSERTEIYKKYIKRLIDEDKAYISKEEDGKNEIVIRFKNPNKKIIFEDVVRGKIEFDTTELKDFIIARNLEDPVYHLTVVIDDFEMGITHVIRGEDHISNTPRQILIQEAIGAERPIYIHIPLVLGKDRRKLSKRHGATALTEYRERGFDPDGLINYLALLGFHPEGDEEILSREELINKFDVSRIQSGGAIFDEEKLRFFSKAHIQKKGLNFGLPKIKEIFLAIEKKIKSEILDRAGETILERIEIWQDLEEAIKNGEYDYLEKEPEINPENLLWKETSKEKTREFLTELQSLLIDIKSGANKEEIKEAIWDYTEKKGRGEVLWPLRFALSGRDKSPDPFTLFYILGKEESLKRIQNALNVL